MVLKIKRGFAPDFRQGFIVKAVQIDLEGYGDPTPPI